MAGASLYQQMPTSFKESIKKGHEPFITGESVNPMQSMDLPSNKRPPALTPEASGSLMGEFAYHVPAAMSFAKYYPFRCLGTCDLLPRITLAMPLDSFNSSSAEPCV
jgi:hypothetical protein